MKVTHHIAQHLLDVYTGGNWTEVNVSGVLADVSYAEAATVTAASPNSIASIVHHLVFWNRIMIQRIQGVLPEIPAANGFDVPWIESDADWKNLLNAMLASAAELALEIKNVADAKLEMPIVTGFTSAYKNLQGTVEHIHYHLGEIMILKKLIRSGN